MLSLTSEYALRAMVYLAQHEDDAPIPGNRIAKDAGIPAKYLSKVLGDLARAGVLEGMRGKNGGFRLVRPASKVVLLEVLAPFERFDRRRCPFGNKECGDENPCVAHDQWKRVIETYQRFLAKTSVRDVALARGGRRGGRPPTKRRSR